MTMLVQAPPPDAIAGQMAMLAAYFGAALEPPVLRLYVDALRHVPAADVRAACRRLIASSRFMPKVAELLEAVEAVGVEQRAAEQRQAQDAARREARGPFTVFGRMSKNAVLHRFRGFIADDPCDCLACFDAQVAGPPRFVPDGVSPAPNCVRCDDCGWVQVSERNDTAAPSFRKCGCVGSNNNLVESTRDHTIEMGRWLHGAELREHEQAQAAYEAAVRGWVQRSRMPQAVEA